MFPCPKCDYALEITKNISKEKSSEKKIKVLNISSFLNNILNNIPIKKNMIINFSVDALKKSNMYKKLDKDNKTKAINTITKLKQIKSSNVHFICGNCGYYTALKDKTLLFSKNHKTTVPPLITKDYELKCYDPTLPRTKNYICKNKKCITHDKKNEKSKEAVWFRQINSHQLVYVCCVCKHGWLI